MVNGVRIVLIKNYVKVKNVLCVMKRVLPVILIVYTGVVGMNYNLEMCSNVLTKRKWVHVTIVKTEVRPNIYIDGVLVAMTDTVSTDLTDWFAEFTGLDEGRIGCRTLNGAEDQFLLGVMGPVKFWTIELYANEVLRESQEESTQSEETGRQAIIAAALLNHWGWDGVLTDAGTGADTAVVVAHAYLSGWSSEWSRLIETRGYTNAADQFNTFRDGAEYVTIAIQGA